MSSEGFEELKKDQPWICWRGQEKVAKYVWDHQQSKLDAKDELLKEAVELIALLTPTESIPNSFLNKPEIKALRGEE